jgi:hypothetical protein
MNNKDRKEEYKDDGRTIADMNVEGFSWYNKNKPRDSKNQIYLTRKERRAIFQAMVSKMIPIAIIALVALTLSFLLIKLWLS